MQLNRQKLLQAEARFLARYPGGFEDPGLAAVRKKHNVGRLVDFARDNLGRGCFNRPAQVADSVLKLVSRSSMVSRFEKPRLRDFIACLNGREQEAFALAMEKRLYGRSKNQGFDELVGMLQPFGLAKWSVVSAVPFYLAPQAEAFVKPTTAKGIIANLEVQGLEYLPTPTWAFYQGYRRLLREVRATVSPALSPNYAALTGFLMSSF